MRIAVMGAGGLGGCLGGLLARSGNDVILIARGAHLDAIRRNGLRIKRRTEEFMVKVDATDDPSQVGTVDRVLFTVKTYHNPQAIPAIKPMVGPSTNVLTFQNGVESHDQLGAVLGQEHCLPGAFWASATVEAPGIIAEAVEARISFGEADGTESPRVQEIQRIFQDAGVVVEVSSDALQVLWTKFVLLASAAGITSASRTRIKALIQYPEVRKLLLAAVSEAEAVGRARGVNLPQVIAEQRVSYIESLPDDFQTSMHVDLENGRPLELEALNGAVVRIGREVGVLTPIHSLLYAVLQPHKNGAAAHS